MIKIIKRERGYTLANEENNYISIKSIGNMIRETGSDVLVETAEGYDMTKETLFRVAFTDSLPFNFSDERVSLITELIDEELLLLVVENGGIENYRNRKARGAVNE